MHSLYRRLSLLIVLFALLGLVATLSVARADPDGSMRLHLPLVMWSLPPTPAPTPTPSPPPAPTPTPSPPPLDCRVSSYILLSASGGPPDRDHEAHADLKLSVRGWQATGGHLGLVRYNGDTDPGAPNLSGLFAPARIPAVTSNYQVFDWDWACNCRRGPITTWPVTLVGLGTWRGEPLHLPNRPGGEIDPAGYKALVLYANETSITLKYTRDNNVVQGYTLHVDGVCVDPDLVALYRTANAAGRALLPALFPGQSFGRSIDGEVRVAIRDNGSFMDPRSCKDWWGWACDGAPPAGIEIDPATHGDGLRE